MSTMSNRPEGGDPPEHHAAERQSKGDGLRLPVAIWIWGGHSLDLV